MFARKVITENHNPYESNKNTSSLVSHNFDYNKVRDKINFTQQKYAEYKSELQFLNFEDNTMIVDEDVDKDKEEKKKKDALDIYYEQQGGKLDKL